MFRLILAVLVLGSFATSAMAAEYTTTMVNGQLMTKLPCGKLVPGNIGNDNSGALTYANLDPQTRTLRRGNNGPTTR
jgi:hypothetical protein